MPKKIIVFLLIALVCTLTVSANIDNSIITIKPDISSDVGEISHMMYGAGIEYYAGGLSNSLLDARIIEMMKADNLGHIRFPNGTSALWYMWHNPLKSVLYAGTNDDTLHTDTVVEFCNRIGAEPVFQVNTYAYYDFNKTTTVVVDSSNYLDGAAYAAAWVEYCNSPNDGSNPNGGIDWAAARAERGHGEPFNVKYWEIGNEDWVRYTGADFRLVSDAYASAMKSVDSNIEIIYQGFHNNEGYVTDEQFFSGVEFNEGMLSTKGSVNSDYLSTHFYFGFNRLATDEFTLNLNNWDLVGDGWSHIDTDKNAKLIQSTNTSYPTFALFKSLPMATDYTLNCTLKNRSSDGSGGVVFNYTDSNNYNSAIIKSVDNCTVLQVNAIQNGVVQVLAQSKISDSYDITDNIVMSISTKGGRIRANAWKTTETQKDWIIDIENNTTNFSGYMGFIACVNSIVAFDNFIVHDYGCVLYDDFNCEDELQHYSLTDNSWCITENGTLSQPQSLSGVSVAKFSGGAEYYDFTAKIEISGLEYSEKAGFAFGLTDSNDYYVAVASFNCTYIYKVDGAIMTMVAELPLDTSFNYNEKFSFELKTEIYNDEAIVKTRTYNDRIKNTKWSSTILSEKVVGTIGLLTAENAMAEFDNLSITREYDKYFSFEDTSKWTMSENVWSAGDNGLIANNQNSICDLAYLNRMAYSNDYTVTLRMNDACNGIGIAFAIKDSGADYLMAYVENNSNLVLTRVINGTATDVERSALDTALSSDDNRFLEVALNQGIAKVTVCDASGQKPLPQLSINLNEADRSGLSGKLGIAILPNTTAAINNFEYLNGYEITKSNVLAASGRVKARNDLNYIDEKIAETGSSCNKYISEYNHMEFEDDLLDYYVSQNYAQAVLVADWIGKMIESNVNMASMHCVMGPENFRMYSAYNENERNNPKKQASLFGLAMFSRYFGNHRISVDTNNNQVYAYNRIENGVLKTVNVNAVSVYGSVDTNKNSLEIMLINKDVDNNKQIMIDMSDIEYLSDIGKIRLFGADNEITNGNLGCAKIADITESTINLSGGDLNLVLPAHSIMEVSIPLGQVYKSIPLNYNLYYGTNNFYVNNMEIPNNAIRFGLWIFGDGSKNNLSFELNNANNEKKYKSFEIDWTGWRYKEFDIENVTLLSGVSISDGNYKKNGTIFLSSASIFENKLTYMQNGQEITKSSDLTEGVLNVNGEFSDDARNAAFVVGIYTVNNGNIKLISVGADNYESYVEGQKFNINVNIPKIGDGEYLIKTFIVNDLNNLMPLASPLVLK